MFYFQTCAIINTMRIAVTMETTAILLMYFKDSSDYLFNSNSIALLPLPPDFSSDAGAKSASNR